MFHRILKSKALFGAFAVFALAACSGREPARPAIEKTEKVILERPLGVEVLADGRFLVTDGGGAFRWDETGSKVFILDRSGRVSWVYDQGLSFAHSAIMLKNGNVLVPDTNHNRLLEVSKEKKIVWSSETWPDRKLADGSRLDYPNHVRELENGRFLVSDRNSSRVLELDREGKIYWSFSGAKRQHAPRPLATGNILLTDSEGNRAIEVDRSGRVVWSYGTGLNWPRRAERLENGDTLITDSNNHRLLLVSKDGRLLREFKAGFCTPYEAQVLAGGNILVCDAQHARLAELNAAGEVVWEFRNIVYPAYPQAPLDPDMEEVTAEVGPGIDPAKRGRPETGWFVADMVGHGSGTWKPDRTAVRGKQSLFIEAPAGPTEKRWWGQRISVRPGTAISLFCSVKTDLSSGGAGLGLTWLDRQGGNIGGASSKPVTGKNAWTAVPLRAIVPPGAAFAEISLSLTGGGSAWFDGLEFAAK